jgi:predicted ribosomally synthesized peptide with nif11-like leader
MANDAMSFLNAVDQDPTLRAKLKGPMDHIVRTAREHGFEVSEDDLRQVLRDRWGMASPSHHETNPDTCFFA